MTYLICRPFDVLAMGCYTCVYSDEGTRASAAGEADNKLKSSVYRLNGAWNGRIVWLFTASLPIAAAKFWRTLIFANQRRI